VLDDVFQGKHGSYPAGTWLRSPHLSLHQPLVIRFVLFWSKQAIYPSLKNKSKNMKHFSELSAMAEHVVNAAESLIQERGYNGFSYDDIARIVGIKKPSIHHHFSTKSELVSVVAQRYTHRFRENLLQIEGQHAKAQDRLSAYATLFEETYKIDQHLCLCGMLGAEASSLPENIVLEVHRFFEVNLDWLTQIIEEGQRAGQLNKALFSRDIAETFLSSLEGAMIIGRGMRSTIGPAKIAQSLLSTLSLTAA
jgi:TetR/AcrR family transcriptional repressor of nem operon